MVEKEAFRRDLEKQVGCAHVELRQEALRAEEAAGAKEWRRWIYSRQVRG